MVCWLPAICIFISHYLLYSSNTVTLAEHGTFHPLLLSQTQGQFAGRAITAPHRSSHGRASDHVTSQRANIPIQALTSSAEKHLHIPQVKSEPVILPLTRQQLLNQHIYNFETRPNYRIFTSQG